MRASRILQKVLTLTLVILFAGNLILTSYIIFKKPEKQWPAAIEVVVPQNAAMSSLAPSQAGKC